MITLRSFVKRLPELLALEGWYDVGTYSFKLSCRFNDFLRCSAFNGKTQHFRSCFARGGGYEEQPSLRCLNPSWAIIYTPDKHGNFLGRAFAYLEVTSDGSHLVVDKIYGNRLKFDDVKDKLMKKHNVNCQASRLDTYLSREAS